MDCSFKDIYTRARATVETDKYVIYQTLKSKLYFSGNYLLMKKTPETVEELDYYIVACRNFFREKGVDFIHLASQENSTLPRKLKKYLKKEKYSEINLDLYHLEKEYFIEQEISGYDVEYLQRKDLGRYLEFQYKIDLESANEEWAEHNQTLLYEEVRSDIIKKLVAKDGEEIIATVNLIVRSDYFELDNLYVAPAYRRKGVAMHLIDFAIRNENKDDVILVADANDTPKYMYEKIGFKKVAEQDFYLRTKL